MSVKHFCDKQGCGKEIKLTNSYQITFGKVNSDADEDWHAGSVELNNLCHKCYKKFLGWLNNG